MTGKVSTPNNLPPNSDFAQLEERLQRALYEVTPPKEFVSQLKRRLGRPPSARGSTAQVVSYVLLSLLGIVSGALLMIAGLRAMLTLLALLGLLEQTGRSRGGLPQVITLD